MLFLFLFFLIVLKLNSFNDEYCVLTYNILNCYQIDLIMANISQYVNFFVIYNVLYEID